MEGNKIRRIVDIPDWFQLENYERTSEFSAKEWAEQLGIRRNINWYLDRNKPIYREAISLFNEIKLQPTFLANTSLEQIEKSDVSNSAYVRPLKCGLVRALSKDIEQHYGLNDSGNLGLNSAITVSRFYEDTESYMRAHVPIVIDLNGSDVDIENDFRNYLKQVREYTGIKSQKTHITPAEFNKLHSYKMLPYLDLMIWERISGFSISAAVLIEALFPAQDDEKYITKTIKPFSKKINLSFIRALESHMP